LLDRSAVRREQVQLVPVELFDRQIIFLGVEPVLAMQPLQRLALRGDRR
jgi:hypothetical protein